MSVVYSMQKVQHRKVKIKIGMLIKLICLCCCELLLLDFPHGMAHISLNETSVEPHEGRIHDQKKTLPLNRMFSPMKSRRKTKHSTERRDTLKKVANLSLELKNFNQGWQYKAESPSRSLHESALHSR